MCEIDARKDLNEERVLTVETAKTRILVCVVPKWYVELDLVYWSWKRILAGQSIKSKSGQRCSI